LLFKEQPRTRSVQDEHKTEILTSRLLSGLSVSLPGGGRVQLLQIGSLNLAVLAECWFRDGDPLLRSCLSQL
jgi:hypothetical protein